MSTTSRNVIVAAIAATIGALVLLMALVPTAAAEEHPQPRCGEVVDGALVICVTHDGYQPDAVTVEEGERIRWVWVDGDALRPHTVTAEPDSQGRVAFDSDAACGSEDAADCRRAGHTYEWTARTGSHAYYCRAARDSTLRSDMTAAIEVTAAPAPSPSPEQTPTPEGSPSSEGSPSPTPEGSPEPTDGASADEGSSASGDQASERPRRAQQRSAPRMTQRSRPLEREGSDPAVEAEPEVAAPDATFSPFPSPAPMPTQDPGDDDLGELTIGESDGPFTPTRTQWVGLAFASLALSAGAFAKVVFLGGTFG